MIIHKLPLFKGIHEHSVVPNQVGNDVTLVAVVVRLLLRLKKPSCNDDHFYLFFALKLDGCKKQNPSCVLQLGFY